MTRDLEMLAAMERAEIYFRAHPASPSAVRRPRIFRTAGTWVALLGSSIENGLAGFGPTIDAALRAFDAQYHAALQPPPSATIQRIGPS